MVAEPTRAEESAGDRKGKETNERGSILDHGHRAITSLRCLFEGFIAHRAPIVRIIQGAGRGRERSSLFEFQKGKICM